MLVCSMSNVVGQSELSICCNCAACELKCEMVVVLGVVNGVMFNVKFPELKGEF